MSRDRQLTDPTEVSASDAFKTALAQSAYTQMALANELGVSQGTIWQWANRRLAIPAEQAVRVARLLEVQADRISAEHERLHALWRATLTPSSQPARLTGPMLAGASRMAREAVELAGGEWMGAEHSPEEADLLALALGDVLENGLTEVTDADVMRFAKKVNGGRKDAGGSGRENGGAGSDDRATQAGENARPARRRRA